MKKLMFTLLFSITGFCLMAQDAPEIEWFKTYGGSQGDVANSIIQTSDKGYAVAGYTNSKGSGNSDFWVLKLDSEGNNEWEKTFGGGLYDVAKSIISTTDGGYLVTGDTKSQGNGSVDIWVLKLDARGELIWQKTFGGVKADFAASFNPTVRSASDDGFIITGHTKSDGPGNFDYWIIKIDALGNLVWDKFYGESEEDFVASVIKTTDGGYAVAGNTRSSEDENFNFWLVKLDAEGELMWDKRYENLDIANSIISTTDKGFVIAGNSFRGNGATNMWLTRLDKNGEIIWEKTYGGSDLNYANNVINTFDNSFIVSGFTSSKSAGNNDIWIIKVDNVGNLVWEKKFGGSDDDRGIPIINTASGEYVIAGNTKSSGEGKDDMVILKFKGYLFDFERNITGKLDSSAYLIKPQEDGESLKAYKSRLADYEEEKAELIAQEQEKYDIEAKGKIIESYKPITAKIAAISYYNADAEAYKILLDKWYILPMSAVDAVKFKGDFAYVEVTGLKRLSANLKRSEYINFEINDTITGTTHKIGKRIKKDETLKIYLEKIKTDSIPQNIEAVTFDKGTAGSPGEGFVDPKLAEDCKWQSELKCFKKNPNMDQCMSSELQAHKDLIKNRDEFESTADYSKRFAEYQKIKAATKIKCKQDFYDQNEDKLRKSYRYVSFRLEEVGYYNSARQYFNVKVKGKSYRAIVTPTYSKSFRDNWKNMEVKGICRLTMDIKTEEYINLQIFDAEAGKKYPIGKQVKPGKNKLLKEFYKK